MSIRVSEKYGLNPTIPVCFFCGEEKNEIALLGKITNKQTREEVAAPMKMVLDYEPCEKCKQQWQYGVAIIEVTQKDLGRPEIAPNAQPTGRVVVLKEECVDGYVAGDKCLMIDSEFEQMFGGIK